MSVKQTTDGGYIIAGYSESFDGDVTINHSSQDYWIVKLDTFGTLQWQSSYGGSAYDVASSIQQTTEGGYVIAGYSESNDIDVTGNHGGFDYWVVKLGAITVGKSEIRNLNSTLYISPNPTTSQLTIQTQDLKLKELHIYNVLGELVQQFEITNPKSEVKIDVSELKTGIYFVEVSSNKGLVRAKFIKE